MKEDLGTSSGTAGGAVTTGDQRPVIATPTLIEKLDAICNEIYERWDVDMRSGKLLSALAGRLPSTYRAEVRDVRRALNAYDDMVLALRAVHAPYANMTEETLRAGVLMEFGPPKPKHGAAQLLVRAAIAKVDAVLP